MSQFYTNVTIINRLCVSNYYQYSIMIFYLNAHDQCMTLPFAICSIVKQCWSMGYVSLLTLSFMKQEFEFIHVHSNLASGNFICLIKPMKSSLKVLGVYRLDEVDEAYKSISPLHTKLMDLKKENTRYCQVFKEFTDCTYTPHIDMNLLENF